MDLLTFLFFAFLVVLLAIYIIISVFLYKSCEKGIRLIEDSIRFDCEGEIEPFEVEE